MSHGDYASCFGQIEQKWQAYWRDHKTYEVGDDSSKPKYYVLDMFPYPSGEGLHVGHPVGYIASDIMARYQMLQGYNVLHPMGFDAFGLPAEQYAIQTGQHPRETTEKNMARYEEQLKKIGLAYDWSRKVVTSDPGYYHWTQWVFLKLYHHWYNTDLQKACPISELVSHLAEYGTIGLAAATHKPVELSPHEWQALSEGEAEEVLQSYRLVYLDDALVNWCEALGTVLANDEISGGLSVRGGHPVRQKKMKHWKLRVSAYAPRLMAGLAELDWSDALKSIQRNWIGQSLGTEILFDVVGGSQKLKIFTTRADTLFGVSFMVMAPEHPQVLALTTKEQSPAVKEYLAAVASQSLRERYLAKSSPTGVFTGSYAKHPLTSDTVAIWVSEYVLMDYGEGAIMAVPADDERDLAFAEHFALPILSDHKSSAGLEDMSQEDGICEVEKWLREKQCGCPKTSYKLRDAIFARQRYWGEPIPIAYDSGTPKPLSEADLPLELPPMEDFAPRGRPPLSLAPEWKSPQDDPLEVSTMPGYAGSSAYYLRYMDPHNSEALVSQEAASYWQNVDLYVGGAEHATGHLIYSRTWNMFLWDIGVSKSPEPFQKLLNQGMILGESQYIHRIKGSQKFVSYGLHQQHSTQKIPISIQLVRKGELDKEAFRKWRPDFQDAEFICDNGRFLCEPVTEKMSKSLFNTVTPDEIIAVYGADTLRLYEMFLGPIDQPKPWSSEKIAGVQRFLARFWRLFHKDGEFAVFQQPATDQELRILHGVIKAVRQSTDSFHFNVAISHLMKATSELTKRECRKQEILEPLVILIAPYCPHLAEELYSKLGHQGSVFHLASLPDHDPAWLKKDHYELPVSVNGKLKFKVVAATSATESELKEVVQGHSQFAQVTHGREVKKWIIRPGAIVNLVVS